MATFEVQYGGKTYEVEAPDQETALRVVKSAPQKPYSGTLLPFSKDEHGNVSFDSNAGILGAGKRLIGGIDDVMSGRVDPTSDQGIANITDAALVGTPVGVGTRGGLGWAGAATRSKAPVKVPTSKELVDTGGFGFDMARQMDVRYSPAAVQNMALKLQSRLFKAGYRDTRESAKSVYTELKGLTKPAESGAFASIDDLHSVRAALRKAAENFNNPTGQKAAVEAIKEIDKFIANPDPASVVAGPAAAAGGVWKDAMGNYAAGKRSERIRGVEKNAELDAAVANSGGNLENRIRSRVGAILKSDRLKAGYSPEELAIMDEIARGTPIRNLTRRIGNLGGGGGALAALMGGMGLHFGGPLGLAAAAAVPFGAKVAGNRMAQSALGKADTAIRQRSPLYEQRLATAPAPPPLASPGTRSAMGRVVMGERAVKADKEGLFEELEKNRILPQEYEEYLRLKYATRKGA